MTEAKTYTGGCHCGKVRFEVRAQIDKAMSCNCSICSKSGTLLAFVPAEQFTLLSGENALTEYQFHKKQIYHLFCQTCGIRSFSRGKRPPDGAKVYAVNVRCLDNVDLSALTIGSFDGKSL